MTEARFTTTFLLVDSCNDLILKIMCSEDLEQIYSEVVDDLIQIKTDILESLLIPTT